MHLGRLRLFCGSKVRGKLIRTGQHIRQLWGQLPAGWEKAETAEGRVYYLDHSTGTTQWERPANPSTVHPGDFARPPPGQQYAFALIKPQDPHSDLWSPTNAIAMMFGMRSIRRGANLLSLVCVPISDSGSTTSISTLELESLQSKAEGDSLNNLVLSWVSRASHGFVGPFHLSKIADSAPVVVSTELDSLAVSAVAADQLGRAVVGAGGSDSLAAAMTDANANLSQAYGLLRRDPDEETGMLHVEFPRTDEGTHFAHEDMPGFRLLYETAPREGVPYGGWYCAVHPGRVVAHAAFRHMFITESLAALQWHMALLYPEPLPLSALRFTDATTGRDVAEGSAEMWEGYAFGRLKRGEVQVTAHGRPVRVLDPLGLA